MKRITLIIALVAIFGLTAWTLLSNKATVESKVYQPDPNLRVGVRTAVAQLRNLSQETEFIGSFSPNRQAEIRPQVNGEIIHLPVEEGQNIRAGQLIAKLDDAQLRYQLETLKVSLEGYQNDLRRYQALVKGDATPAVNVERTELSIRSTKAQIKQIQKQIANTTIRAPFSGVVTSKLIEQGSVVQLGTPIAEVTDITSLKLIVEVPEKAIHRFRAGASIPVRTEVYPQVEFTGKVIMISAEGDAAHNYPIQIKVQNSENNPLKAGMYGTIADKHESKEKVLSVPRQAITGSAKQPQVYVVENGKAVLREVIIGATTNQYYEITKGLKAGDQVVTSGQINLQNGTLVAAQ